MNKRRAVVLLVFVFVVSFALVHVEAQKVRLGRDIGRLSREIREVNYERWACEAMEARLRSPAELEKRRAQMPCGALPPVRMVAAESESGEPVAVGQVGR